MCPSDPQMFQYWKSIASHNFSLYDEVFAVLPNNEVDALPSTGMYIVWNLQYNFLCVTNIWKHPVFLL